RITLSNEIKNLAQQFGRVDRPCRIVWRDKSDCFHARIESRLHITKLWQKVVIFRTWDEMGTNTQHLQRGFLVEVIWVRQRNLIARSSDRHSGADKGLITA